MKIIGSYNQFLIAVESYNIYHRPKDRPDWSLAVENYPQNYHNIDIVHHYILFTDHKKPYNIPPL